MTTWVSGGTGSSLFGADTYGSGYYGGGVEAVTEIQIAGGVLARYALPYDAEDPHAEAVMADIAEAYPVKPL